MTASGSPFTSTGATLSLRSVDPVTNSDGSVLATAPADTLIGRLAQISADIETKDVVGFASLWLRADRGDGMLVINNGADQGIKGSTTGAKHMDVTLYVPTSATSITFGLLVAGTGEATARNVRIIARPLMTANAPLAREAQEELDDAIRKVRRYSLWRDTVTWNRVEPEVRAIAAGAETPEGTYPAIRELLARLGDHHSLLMRPPGASASRTGGAENPRPVIRVQSDGFGYIAVPAYHGVDEVAADAYVRAVQDSLGRVVAAGAGTCRWIVDLRGNGGGNMQPMLAGLRPFLGEVELGSFISATGSISHWRAGDRNDTLPAPALAVLESANVAVLTGPRTGSSGEVVTISFIGRPRTRSFGLPTAGLSTGNATMTLPDGAHIILAVSVEADRNGKRYGDRITPDEVVPASVGGQRDAQIDRAIRWLSAQTCPPAPRALRP